jgi:hypothetical protein
LAVVHFDLAVDDYEVDSQRVLVRLFKRRAIDYRPGIEDRKLEEALSKNLIGASFEICHFNLRGKLRSAN